MNRSISGNIIRIVTFGLCIDGKKEGNDLRILLRPISDDIEWVGDGRTIKINIKTVNRIINDFVIGHHVK